MSHYDNPLTMTYSIAALAFGGASSTRGIKPPKNMNRGNVRDIMTSVTVLFTAVTTAAFLKVGHAGDDDYFAIVSMGTAAAGAGYGLRDNGSIFKMIDLLNDPTPGVLTQILLTFTASTGGSPAGTADVNVCIDWF